MGRGKGILKLRGDSTLFDFYYKNQRIRATLPLSLKNKEHKKTLEALMSSIQSDIALDRFKLSKYFPDHPLVKRFQLASDIKISTQLETWLKQKQNDLALSTLRDYRSAVDYHLIPVFGEITISELTTTQVRNWLYTLDISNQRKNNVLIPLRAIFGDAYADELIDRNPLDRIKQLPRKNSEPDPFTTQEINLILDNCTGQIRNIFRFAFWTGLRTSELIALRWSDIDLKKKTAYIRHVRTRTGDKDIPKTDASIRNIELLDPSLEALLEQKKYTFEQGEHIFHNPITDLPWKHDGPLRKTAWKPTLELAGVPYRKPYSTRHTYASQMLSAGVNPMLVAKQMGHKDWGMLRKVYGRWLPNTDASISKKVSYLWAQNGHKGDASA